MTGRAHHRPKGPSSLSPAQRAGYACRPTMRPEGPRYVVAEWAAAGYRAPLGRLNVSVAVYPGHCPGLRDGAPLALSLRPNGLQFLSPAHRAGSSSAQKSCGLKGRDNRRPHRPPGEILKALGQPEAEIQQGMKELEGMLRGVCLGCDNRGPSGRRELLVARYPARWAGLRDYGPLGLAFSANGAPFLSPGQRPGCASTTNTMRPERPRYDGRRR